MNSMLNSQYELTVRSHAPALPIACTAVNHDTTPSYTTWLGGIGSKVTTFEVFASKRPSTRPFAEAVT